MEGCAMGQVLHGSATTTEAIRRAIQHSQESLRALAKRYGVNQKTVRKWKGRSSVADIRTGPTQPKIDGAVGRGGGDRRRLGTVGNLVCGAIVKPQEAGYGDQEGHVGRAFVGARSEGGVFQGWAFRRAEESAGRARLERGTGRPSRWPGGGGQGQSPQWLFEEDGADPECQAGLAYSARSGRHVRPEADRPVSAAVSGLRREDRLHVRARHDDPGDPGSSNGDLWARRVARPNLDSDRRSPGGRGRMAESAARADVSDRLL